MCDKLAQMREEGSRLNIIMVSEGAIDQSGNRISSDDVCKAIKVSTCLQLAKAQRWGSSTFFLRQNFTMTLALQC